MDNNLFKKIADESLKLGICDKWYNLIKGSQNMEFVAKLFFLGSDWSMENNFPNLELAREIKHLIEPYNILVDFDKQIHHLYDEMALIGNSNIEVKHSGFEVVNYYVRDNSILKLKASENCIINITATGNSIIFTESIDNAKINIYKTENVGVFNRGNVNVKPINYE